jgi:hypothetical protein
LFSLDIILIACGKQFFLQTDGERAALYRKQKKPASTKGAGFFWTHTPPKGYVWQEQKVETYENMTALSYESKNHLAEIFKIACLFSGETNKKEIREIVYDTNAGSLVRTGEALGLSPMQFAVELGKFFGEAERAANATYAALRRWIGNGAMYLQKYGRLGLNAERGENHGKRGFLAAVQAEDSDRGVFYRDCYTRLVDRDRRLNRIGTFNQIYDLLKTTPQDARVKITEKLLAVRDWTISYGDVKAALASLGTVAARAQAATAQYGDEILDFLVKTAGAPAVAHWFSKVHIEHRDGQITITESRAFPGTMYVDWIQNHYKAALGALGKRFGAVVHVRRTAAPAQQPRVQQQPPKPRPAESGGFRLFSTFAPPGK